MRERARRVSTDTAIRVFHEDQGYRAHAVNITSSGAGLNGVGQLPTGAKVTIRYLHLCVRAEVAWSNDQATGVRFIPPLQEEQLRAILAGAAALGGQPLLCPSA